MLKFNAVRNLSGKKSDARCLQWMLLWIASILIQLLGGEAPLDAALANS